MFSVHTGGTALCGAADLGGNATGETLFSVGIVSSKIDGQKAAGGFLRSSERAWKRPAEDVPTPRQAGPPCPFALAVAFTRSRIATAIGAIEGGMYRSTALALRCGKHHSVVSRSLATALKAY
jgi:hypothetical protein